RRRPGNNMFEMKVLETLETISSGFELKQFKFKLLKRHRFDRPRRQTVSVIPTGKSIPKRLSRSDTEPAKNSKKKSKNDQISLIMDRKEERELLPDVLDRETVISLAKMTYKLTPKSPTETNSSFGWGNDGVRGHVFSDEDNGLSIIYYSHAVALRLIPPCVIVILKVLIAIWIWCKKNLFKVIADSYPGAKVWSTGHSLGGALSALVGLTYGIPVVAYESPGERLPAKRLHLP
ncbi:9335_t:CDS:2, partial [Gigaspora rosea]